MAGEYISPGEQAHNELVAKKARAEQIKGAQTPEQIAKVAQELYGVDILKGTEAEHQKAMQDMMADKNKKGFAAELGGLFVSLMRAKSKKAEPKPMEKPAEYVSEKERAQKAQAEMTEKLAGMQTADQLISGAKELFQVDLTDISAVQRAVEKLVASGADGRQKGMDLSNLYARYSKTKEGTPDNVIDFPIKGKGGREQKSA